MCVRVCILRTVILLRGLSVGIGLNYLCAQQWKPIAEEALLASGRLSPGLRTRSIDSIIEVSGLKISMEKSTIYYVGMQENVRQQLEQRYRFNSGTLPVRYLGLPLLTRRMGKSDYAILIEKIRNRINH